VPGNQSVTGGSAPPDPSTRALMSPGRGGASGNAGTAPGKARIVNDEQVGGGTPEMPPEAPTRPPVTWGWLHALASLAVAIAPVLILSLASLLADSGQQESVQPSTSIAASTVAITAVLDGWYLFAAWLFSLRTGGGGLRAWGFRRPARSILWAVPVALMAVYAVSVIYNMLVNAEEQDIIQSFPHGAAGVILFLLLGCVIAPFFEETFFRGFLFQGFAKSWGVALGAVASAVVFSLSHQQFDIFVPLFALGLALAWVYHVTHSVWGSIALHAVYNAVAVIAWAAGG